MSGPLVGWPSLDGPFLERCWPAMQADHALELFADPAGRNLAADASLQDLLHGRQ